MDYEYLTPDQWQQALQAVGVRVVTAATWAAPFAETVVPSAFSKGKEEIPYLIGQVMHECALLEHLAENLDYRADRIRQLGAQQGGHWALAALRADELAHNPEGLANCIYGGRFGNKGPGDGWLYRARSPIGLTFHDNYGWVGDLMGQDLLGLPGLIEQPRYALDATIHWWEGRIPDAYLGDVVRITRRVNGGNLGEADREALTAKAQQALTAFA